MLLGWQEALTQQPASATITVDGPTTALAITPSAFLQLLRETPALQHHFVVAAAADFRHAQAALQVRATAKLWAQQLSWLRRAAWVALIGTHLCNQSFS